MSEQEPEADLKPGTLVGERYKVVGVLGKGGIGVVYEAENTWTKRRVAIKLLQPKVAADPEQVERFRQEAQTTSALRHPNIVDILDMGPDGATGRLFMVQEFLDGETLQSLLGARKRLPAREACDLLLPVMGALAAAHSKGVLHRDIKPGNIFLSRDLHGEIVPKVIDFGLARLLNDDPELRKTRTGSIVGTPYYMSPEQARGEGGVDERIDVWAVGAVLFEAITGEVPFEGDNALAVMWKIASEPARRADAVSPDVPRDVADIVAKMLMNKRDERLATMRGAIEAALTCPSLASPTSSLALRHARSLPPELTRRPSSPPSEDLALKPTLPATSVGLVAAADNDLRATPFGWASRPGVRSTSRKRVSPLVLGGALIALALPLALLFLRGSRSTTAPGSHAPPALTIAPVVVAHPASPSPEVDAATPIAPSVAIAPTAAAGVVAASTPRSAVANHLDGQRRAGGRAQVATQRAQVVRRDRGVRNPVTTVPAATTTRRSAYDPEQLLENTQ